MFREDLYNTTVVIEDPSETATKIAPIELPFDKSTPGGAKAKETKYRPANGLENEVSLGGPRTRDNITLTRLYDETVDEVAHTIDSLIGRAKVKVTRQPIDDNGHNWGKAWIFNGKLEAATPPPSDSMSEKPAIYEIVVSTETNVS